MGFWKWGLSKNMALAIIIQKVLQEIWYIVENTDNNDKFPHIAERFAYLCECRYQRFRKFCTGV